jgi:hypothetical protein
MPDPLVQEGGHDNPLVALAVALIQAILSFLQAIKFSVGWVTITFPG